eukprot:TRINITY_DN14977_c0_g1_i1.p1 TRINITY_DN14977_c0_g1~~TRINITY_DN14977_c0_g1_i1.p1  ORF type:complete len:485 (+),score=75.38 TRINITY_DN14977_c0_g1_i1:86-1540(+)
MQFSDGGGERDAPREALAAAAGSPTADAAAASPAADGARAAAGGAAPAGGEGLIVPPPLITELWGRVLAYCVDEAAWAWSCTCRGARRLLAGDERTACRAAAAAWLGRLAPAYRPATVVKPSAAFRYSGLCTLVAVALTDSHVCCLELSSRHCGQHFVSVFSIDTGELLAWAPHWTWTTQSAMAVCSEGADGDRGRRGQDAVVYLPFSPEPETSSILRPVARRPQPAAERLGSGIAAANSHSDPTAPDGGGACEAGVWAPGPCGHPSGIMRVCLSDAGPTSQECPSQSAGLGMPGWTGWSERSCYAPMLAATGRVLLLCGQSSFELVESTARDIRPLRSVPFCSRTEVVSCALSVCGEWLGVVRFALAEQRPREPRMRVTFQSLRVRGGAVDDRALGDGFAERPCGGGHSAVTSVALNHLAEPTAVYCAPGGSTIVAVHRALIRATTACVVYRPTQESGIASWHIRRVCVALCFSATSDATQGG